MTLPSNVEYATIRGRFLRAVADGGDAGREPDGVAIPDLTVTITANLSPAIVRNTSATPPVMFAIDPIVCTADSDGYLVDPLGTREVMVVASDDADLTPHDWTYKATLRAPSIPTLSFSFVAPSGEVVDLPSVTPVPASPGQDIPAWTVVVSEAVSARDAARSSELAAADFAEQAGTAAAAAAAAAVEDATGVPGGVAPLDAESRVPDVNLPARLSSDELSAAFAARVKTGVVTRNADGSIATTVEDGVTHTYGRDASGAIVTDSTSSRVVTYTRDTAGITGWTTGAPQ